MELGGYACEEYPDRLGAVRVPLYGHKNEKDKIIEELVVDVTTATGLSQETYFPRLPVDGAIVEDASSVTFFQHYFPRARIYVGYGHFASEDVSGYASFKRICQSRGIGLLEVRGVEVVEILQGVPLVDHLRLQIQRIVAGAKDTTVVSDRVGDLLERCTQEYLHYLVYYGGPIFQRREITGRGTRDFSRELMNQLKQLKNIHYRQLLIDLGADYGNELRGDDEIAWDTILQLWKERLGLDYPQMQRDFEPVLLLNPYYRDHFIHTFQVFLLGTLVIDGMYDLPSVDRFTRACGSPFEDVWLLASTYHDFNYPMQDFGSWIRDFLTKSLHIHEASEHADRKSQDDAIVALNLERLVMRDGLRFRIQALCATLSPKEECRGMCIFEQAIVARNHGAIAALTLLRKYHDSSGATLSPQAVNEAALSIMLHDKRVWERFAGTSEKSRWERDCPCQTRLSTMSFEDFPLAFLLIFCDTVQEWGRAGRGYGTAELDRIMVGPDGVTASLCLKDLESCAKMRAEVEKVKQFLRGPEFKIVIHDRDNEGPEVVIEMSGA